MKKLYPLLSVLFFDLLGLWRWTRWRKQEMDYIRNGMRMDRRSGKWLSRMEKWFLKNYGTKMVLRKNNQLFLTHSFFSLSHISTKGYIYGTFFISTCIYCISLKFCCHRSLLWKYFIHYYLYWFLFLLVRNLSTMKPH